MQYSINWKKRLAISTQKHDLKIMQYTIFYNTINILKYKVKPDYKQKVNDTFCKIIHTF